jgi:hypothetical protein
MAARDEEIVRDAIENLFNDAITSDNGTPEDQERFKADGLAALDRLVAERRRMAAHLRNVVNRPSRKRR